MAESTNVETTRGKFLKGKPKTGGRKKGTPNKANANVKAMVLGALEAKGGQKYLERQADENPVAFMGLLGKILPSTLDANVNVTVTQEDALAVIEEAISAAATEQHDRPYH